MKAERVYKLNKEKVEKAVRAMLDELSNEFPEIVEKWMSEQNEYIKVVIFTDPNEKQRKFQIFLPKACYEVVVDFLRKVGEQNEREES